MFDWSAGAHPAAQGRLWRRHSISCHQPTPLRNPWCRFFARRVAGRAQPCAVWCTLHTRSPCPASRWPHARQVPAPANTAMHCTDNRRLLHTVGSWPLEPAARGSWGSQGRRQGLRGGPRLTGACVAADRSGPLCLCTDAPCRHAGRARCVAFDAPAQAMRLGRPQGPRAPASEHSRVRQSNGGGATGFSMASGGRGSSYNCNGQAWACQRHQYCGQSKAIPTL